MDSYKSIKKAKRKSQIALLLAFVAFTVAVSNIVSESEPEPIPVIEQPNTMIVNTESDVSIVWVTDDGEVLPPVKMDETIIRMLLQRQRTTKNKK